MVYKTYRPRRRSFNIFGKKNLSVNTTLILVNVVAFIVFVILLGINPNFIDNVALKPSNVFQGQFLWAFITSMFMHGGIFHLFVNMFSLFFLGTLAERIIGGKRYFWFYMISGLAAGLLFVGIEFLFPTNPNIAAVGASGALFGVVGLLVLLTPNLPVYVMFIPIPIKMKYAGPGILVVLWLITLGPVLFGGQQLLIGNTAHLGGLLAGLVYGFYLRNKYKRKTAMISKHFS